MLKTFAAMIAVFLANCATARAHDWTKVSSPLGGYVPLTTPYFLNANVGFTFKGGIIFSFNELGTYSISQPELERTTDGGITWSVLHFFDTTGYSITQLSFVSLTHGYASSVQFHNFNNGPLSGGIFETFDQGGHWKKITPEGLSFSGVYATNHTIFATEFEIDSNLFGSAEEPIIYSSDDGATWDSITNVVGLTLNAQPQFQYV